MLTSSSHEITSATDETSMEMKKSGLDISMFGSVYEKHYAEVYRFIFRRICDTEKSFDLCSLVFLKAMENLKSYRNEGKPIIAWLYRIALNEIYMQHRKRKAEIIYHIDVSELQYIEDDLGHEKMIELESELLSALQKLDRDEMELIEMRYFEKQQVNMIAEILNTSANNVSVRLFRIIGKLKKILTSNQKS
ncbi:hypothetical protein SDC9_44244 [bioreactor metagenome]|uniref:Uncharacterized protein n=1 Tax=bioreactor metagenome TaxID=1076179 RepID=A0A644W3E5_9ZZZZ